MINSLRSLYSETYEGLVYLDETLDDCIEGIVFVDTPRVCYSYDKILIKLKNSGMTMDEAMDWFDYNIESAYIGKNMPVYLEK